MELSNNDIDDRYLQAIAAGDLSLLKDLASGLICFAEVGQPLLITAVMEEKLDVSRWLLTQGLDPNKFENGYSALYWAVFGKQHDIAELLVEAGATVTINEEPSHGSTALHCAAENGDADLITYLIERAEGSAALLMFDEFDNTPLHRAVSGGSLPAVEALLKAGADPNALVQVHHVGRVGDPPIRDAVADGSLAITELLLRYGADPDRPGWMWNTARYDLGQLSGALRTRMEELLEVRPLDELKDSAHLVEVERQLAVDLEHHGIGGLTISWRGASADGTTVQVRGERLAPFKNVRLTNSTGEVIGRGDFNLLVLTVDIDFRVFWTRIETPDVTLTPGAGNIPAHVWENLSEDQRTWLVMDSRNFCWRSKRPGQLRVDGHGYD